VSGQLDAIHTLHFGASHVSTTRLQIGPADHGRAMTLDEFLEAEEEPGYRYELARGVLEVTEVPNDPHGQIVSNLHALLYAHKTAHPGVILRIGGGSEFRLWVPELISGRNPDAALVLFGTPKDDRGRRRPAWVAEVVSKRGEVRDYQTKRAEYLVYGLREYWIVDPQRLLVTVLIRHDDAGAAEWSERVFRDGETIISGLLPGFAGTVGELWADVEPDESSTE
jgi:Uma2 family endonuclease